MKETYASLLRNKKLYIVLILAVCLAAALGLYFAKGEPEETAEHTVKIQEVGTAGGETGMTFSGNIVPTDTVKVSFKVAGVLADVAVSEGDSVTAGQVIARLETEDYVLAEEAAAAQWKSASMKIDSEVPAAISQAKAQLDLTKTTYDRIKTLYEEGAVSRSQFDEIAAKLTVDQNTYQTALDASAIAETELGQAKAAYDLAVSNLNSTTVYSPIDGVVLQKVSAAGETVSAGYPIVVVGSTDQVWVEAGVTDEWITRLSPGQTAQVYIYGADRTVTAVVDEIGSLADSTTRTFPVKFRIDNADHSLKAGMIAKVTLSDQNVQSIEVPFSSVVHLADKEVVFIYDETEQVARQREVTTGELLGDTIQILSGLSEGDKLIVEGQYRIVDGEKVKLSD